MKPYVIKLWTNSREEKPFTLNHQCWCCAFAYCFLIYKGLFSLWYTYIHTVCFPSLILRITQNYYFWTYASSCLYLFSFFFVIKLVFIYKINKKSLNFSFIINLSSIFIFKQLLSFFYLIEYFVLKKILLFFCYKLLLAVFAVSFNSKNCLIEKTSSETLQRRFSV